MQHLNDVKVLMLMSRTPFSPRMRLDLQERLWDLWRSGQQTDQVGMVLGLSRHTVRNRIVEAGGIPPRRRQTRARLSYEDRVHIEVGLKHKRSMRLIADDLGWWPSTISREVKAHANPDGRYVAKRAHAVAFEAARRPQESKIESNPVLRARILADLGARYSPEQIAGRLRGCQDFCVRNRLLVDLVGSYRWGLMRSG